MDPLTTAAALAADLAGTEPPTVLDIRWTLGGPPGRPAYETGHIPGAAYVDLEATLTGHDPSRGRHPLPDPDVLQQGLRAAGVRGSGRVVTYDAGDGFAAGRAWWVLRWAGHTDVQVLDGGWPAWQAVGLPEQAGCLTPWDGDIVVVPGSLPVLDGPEAAALPEHGILIDVRAPARYRGEAEPIDPVAGHIPGAVNVPTRLSTDGSGGWRAAADLRAHFAEHGIDGSRPVGVYCGSGISAAHTMVALQSAGIAATLYPGSWSEWITDPDRPVATGAETPAAQPTQHSAPR